MALLPKRRSSSRLRAKERVDYYKMLNPPIIRMGSAKKRQRKQKAVAKPKPKSVVEKRSRSTRSNVRQKKQQHAAAVMDASGALKSFPALVRTTFVYTTSVGYGSPKVKTLADLAEMRRPITRSLGTFREIPISAVALEPPKRRSNRVRQEPKARQNTNNTVSGEFAVNIRNAHQALKNMARPYTGDKLSIAIKQAFLDISPQDFDYALKQLAHTVICREGVLAFNVNHGIPGDNLRIVKEDND
ncbi:unnamed protein product [Haemonchus placei]|uniref:Histone domain-containing protein n=1 Tax=Haemonchus placei TaxID=6290 RepID=A0A0N4WHV8_HAEPC|nr:unnamed protein product [Haemonchus placei]